MGSGAFLCLTWLLLLLLGPAKSCCSFCLLRQGVTGVASQARGLGDRPSLLDELLMPWSPAFSANSNQAVIQGHSGRVLVAEMCRIFSWPGDQDYQVSNGRTITTEKGEKTYWDSLVLCQILNKQKTTWKQHVWSSGPHSAWWDALRTTGSENFCFVHCSPCPGILAIASVE